LKGAPEAGEEDGHIVFRDFKLTLGLGVAFSAEMPGDIREVGQGPVDVPGSTGTSGAGFGGRSQIDPFEILRDDGLAFVGDLM
jgi:hypothetical protein